MSYNILVLNENLTKDSDILKPWTKDDQHTISHRKILIVEYILPGGKLFLLCSPHPKKKTTFPMFPVFPDG